MFKLTLVVLAYAFIAVSASPDALVAPAIVTAQSSQYIARNYNALVAPVVAQPVIVKSAAYVSQPGVASQFVAQPLLPRVAQAVVAENYVAQPALAKVAQPVVTNNYVAQPVVSRVAQPTVALRTENYAAQPVLANLAQPVVGKPTAFVAQPVFTAQHAAYVAQPLAAQYLAQPAAYIAQASAKPEEGKTQSTADLFKTAAYVAQSAQPALASRSSAENRKSSEQIRMNPVAETFEPVNKSVDNSEDEDKRVNVDAIAKALAPTVLATRFAGSPVFTYYNPYVAQPVV